MEHQPVLADEVVALFQPVLEHGGVVVDATLGRGGHAYRILEASPRAELVGIDRDDDALEESRSYLEAFGDRVRYARGDFKDLTAVLERLGVAQVAGVLLDLGVSSPQLDRADRGFSYRAGGPLDMRMDRSRGITAEDVVNGYPERELERVIRTYGEERFSKRIARAIVNARPIRDTVVLGEVVRDAIPAATRRTGGHPAKRTFQAIRIEVNDEMRALDSVLPQTVDALGEGGRMVVLSYHSLEDRKVKRFINDRARGCICPPSQPICTCDNEPELRPLTRKPITASDEEKARNPRASAAKMRAAERILADIRALDVEEGRA